MVDGHQKSGFIRLFLRVGTTDHVKSAVDFRAADFMQMLMQPFQIPVRQFSFRELRAEFDVLINLLLFHRSDNRLAVFLPEHLRLSSFILIDFLFQLGKRTVGTGIHERRGQMAHHRGITATLGDQSLAGIVDDIQVIMRHFTNQHVGPVVTGQRNLFPRSEFQTAVRAEVHQGVRIELMPQPEISRQITQRRSLLHAVNQLIGVLAVGRQSLRHQHDVAELKFAEHEIRLSVTLDTQIFSRKLAILFLDAFEQISRKAFPDPGKVFLL